MKTETHCRKSGSVIFLIGLALVVFLFFGILVWTWSLRKQVKARTAELEMSQERYRLLVENASEGVVVITGDRVAFINPRALQILGCTEEELGAKMLFDIVHPADQGIVLDFYFNTLKKEDIVLQYPFRIITEKTSRNGFSTIRSRSNGTRSPAF